MTPTGKKAAPKGEAATKAGAKRTTGTKTVAKRAGVQKAAGKRRPATAKLTWPGVTAMAMRLPGMEISQSYGTPSLKVKGKFMSRLKEDGETLVLRASFVVRDHLIRTWPATFYITDHYRDYPSVLIHISTVDRAVLEQLIEDAWRETAPKKLVQQYDSGLPAPKPRRSR